MKILSIYTPVFLIFFFQACQQPKSHPPVATTPTHNSIRAKPSDTVIVAKPDTANAIEDKVIDAVYALPEVKAFAAEVNKGTNHFVIWVNGHPTAEEPYYWIKVGEDNGSNLVTSYHFFVYPDSMRIMYYDTLEDTVLTLQNWRMKEK